MPRLHEPHPISLSVQSPGLAPAPRMSTRIARAANDNHRTHAAWRRVVASATAGLFAASLILVGLVCIARAEALAPPIIGN